MRVAVLGAGLQGACVAMELASRGVEVDLYDKNEQPLMEASALNEGKIHLGYLYANDPTLKTARLLMRAGLAFSPLLRGWLGAGFDKVPVSSPYYYAVHRGSLLSIDEIEGHLLACGDLAREEAAAGNKDYFGMDVSKDPSRFARPEDLLNPETIVAAFETPEIALSAETLAACVRARLAAEANIRCVLSANVQDVAVKGPGIEVGFEVCGGRSSECYDQVVNALWQGRLAIDDGLGIRPHRPWLFRMRYDLRLPDVPLTATVPSTTVVLGPYGDIVRYENGETFLSWYPAGRTASSSEISPPDWPRTLAGEEAANLRESLFTALIDIVPALAEIAPISQQSGEVKGGVIFAWGSSDISDPTSKLHTRSDIGLQSYGKYHSINTGKLTTAPLFARETADRILGD